MPEKQLSPTEWRDAFYDALHEQLEGDDVVGEHLTYEQLHATDPGAIAAQYAIVLQGHVRRTRWQR